MRRVKGIGGIFFKSKNPKALSDWYRNHFYIHQMHDGTAIFEWRNYDEPEKTGHTMWATFPESSKYFINSDAPFMINYRVEDLYQLLQDLKSEGIEVLSGPVNTEHGSFAWLLDPEGNPVELWEPPENEHEDEANKMN
ncbi:VOC family protein [Bacillus shivajii]|uniref:VOC family protein n=1 Tax=Bacillus shivajii TaxID=1983719 RepID=UPI001CFA9199|nr:VOC family protein [Bacillus shivajii]UCZ54923.1 VOC family protein [Bacillus shivajii]